MFRATIRLQAIVIAVLVTMLGTGMFATTVVAQPVSGEAAEQISAFPAFDQIPGLAQVAGNRWSYLNAPDGPDEIDTFVFSGVMAFTFDSDASADAAFGTIANFGPQLWMVYTFSQSYIEFEGEPFARTAHYVIDPAGDESRQIGDRSITWTFGTRILPSGRAEEDRPTAVTLVRDGNVLFISGMTIENWSERTISPVWMLTDTEALAQRFLDTDGATTIDRLPIDSEDQELFSTSGVFILYENDIPTVTPTPTPTPTEVLIAADPIDPTPSVDATGSPILASPVAGTPNPAGTPATPGNGSDAD
ncbi:MAG: hypothetical protein M9947_14065 [Thermomicrobiales bacterium]|nr:hypothetical protein [Thermomicrobiales bacterium]